MALKQGNTYELICVTKDKINIDEVAKVIFQFNDIEKVYTTEIGETSDVIYEDGKFIVPLSQKETLDLKKSVEYEMAIKFTDNSVKRSEVKTTNSLYTIIKKVI